MNRPIRMIVWTIDLSLFTHMQFIKKFINSPVGPKTTHFWGPALNFGFVIQGLVEWNRPPEKISRDMTMILVLYSLMGMRFAQKVIPMNPALIVMHFCNFSVQSYHVGRRLRWQREQKRTPK